jgi:hypothetical protein
MGKEIGNPSYGRRWRINKTISKIIISLLSPYTPTWIPKKKKKKTKLKRVFFMSIKFILI